jgi:hypothetical protein
MVGAAVIALWNAISFPLEYLLAMEVYYAGAVY